MEPDEIDFEDEYDKADPIDDADLDESITILNESIREQEELQDRLSRAEWLPMNKEEISKLGQRIAFNEKKQGLYIMRTSKTILSILHRGFDKIKQGNRVMVLDEKSAEKLYKRLRLIESDEGTYKISFENESGTLQRRRKVLSSGGDRITAWGLGGAVSPQLVQGRGLVGVQGAKPPEAQRFSQIQPD